LPVCLTGDQKTPFDSPLREEGDQEMVFVIIHYEIGTQMALT